MKKIKILFCIISAALALSILCAAQGNVNSNNGLGAPYGETQNPYSSELSDYTTMPGDTVTETASALLKDSADTAAQINGDMAWAVAVVAVTAVITVASVFVFAAMRKRGEE
jgi:hypothetical protein